MDVREMKAGRELDNLIAEFVMGAIDKDFDEIYTNEWRFKRENGTWFPSCHYSTEISAAWEIVEKLKLTVHPTFGGWNVANCNASGSGETSWVGITNHQKWVYAETAPEAICKAALLAKEGAK